MERVRETTASAANLLSRYEICLAKQEVDELFWKDFCDNYIELVKPRLYNPDTHGAKERGSAQHALYFTLLNLLKLYAIYVPHIAEHIYQSFFRQYENTPSVHQLLWLQPEPANKEILLFGTRIKNALFQVRKSKSESNLSMRAEIPALQVEAEPIFQDWLGLTAKDLQACTNARELKWKPL